jgi:hypothetical protein
LLRTAAPVEVNMVKAERMVVNITHKGREVMAVLLPHNKDTATNSRRRNSINNRISLVVKAS